jgi:hypothetical protein
VVWLVFLCVVLLVLPSPSQERSLRGVGDGGEELELGNQNQLGMEERTSQVSITPDTVLHKHHKHKHPPPPSPSPPPPSPPPPSPPPPPPPSPPPPLAIVTALEISNGALLVPPFDPDVHRYNTTVGEGVTEVHVTVSVPESFDVWLFLFSFFFLD